MAAESPDPGSTSTTLPKQFGKYRIVRLLGRGGMGAVYLAEDTRLSRQVALKVCNVATDDNPTLERFRREAQSAAQLRHANLCPVYEFDVYDSIPYLAMAYIQGPTLAEWMAERVPLEPRSAAVLVVKLAQGMQTAHSRGVIHRDLKPGNVLLEKGEPVIVDFGLARQTSGDAQLTKKGAVLGTPSYMSPEQVAGEGNIGVGCDIYALGVILYELLTGRRPFEGPPGVMLAQILYTPTPSPRIHRPDLDPKLEALCLKAMAKAPAERFASMSDFAKALTPFARATATVAPAPPPIKRKKSKVVVPDTNATQPPTQPTPRPGRPDTGSSPASGTGLYVFLLLLCFAVLAAVVTFPFWKDLLPSSKPDGEEQKKPPDESDVKPGELFTNSLGMKLKLIRPGTFEMGSAADPLAFPDEIAHAVRITRPFYLGTCEVTQEQFEKVMGTKNNPSFFTKEKGGGPNHPVESVTWQEAVEFCRHLADFPAEKKHRRIYRLPTEAEWEYACRAGTTSPYNFGGGAGLKAHGWYDANAGGTTHEGGAKPPNAWGLHDMHGNVAEWCADWYDMGFYRVGPTDDPECKEGGKKRVARGGAWELDARNCRSASRFYGAPDERNKDIGFRVAVTIGEEK